MKIFLIISISLVIIFLISQAFVMNATNKTETHAYTVVKDYKDFEIRTYEPALFSYVVMKSDSYKSVSNQGFRTLAGYIFGGNEKNQKIAMTTPVAMQMSDSVTMKFKVPASMSMEDLPKPVNSNIRFANEPAKTVAAITFSGWSSDERIAEYTAKLTELLEKNQIAHTGKFSYLGYNPPFELTNRRNEVIVELK